MSFEIVGLRYVVENKVTHRGDGAKVKVGKTVQWFVRDTKKGLRWLKTHMGENTVLDGKSPVQMHQHIVHCMMAKAIKVWFSCDTCNIEYDEDLKEVLVSKGKKKQEELLARVRAKMGIEDAKVFKTPHGVMVIGVTAKGGENL